MSERDGIRKKESKKIKDRKRKRGTRYVSGMEKGTRKARR